MLSSERSRAASKFPAGMNFRVNDRTRDAFAEVHSRVNFVTEVLFRTTSVHKICSPISYHLRQAQSDETSDRRGRSFSGFRRRQRNMDAKISGEIVLIDAAMFMATVRGLLLFDRGGRALMGV
jgi:hypothetical protein